MGQAAAAPPSANTKAFEAARDAAKLRAATNIAAVDEVSAASGAISIQHVGTRTFTLKDSIWTDTSIKDAFNRIRVRPFSAAYFRLIEQIPELRDVFALGDRVAVAGKSIIIETGASGVETLSESDLKKVLFQW